MFVLESANTEDLMNELALMSLGQYFLDSFYKWAKVYKVQGLPHKFSIYSHIFRY